MRHLFQPNETFLIQRSDRKSFAGYAAVFFNGDPKTEFHLFENAFERFSRNCNFITRSAECWFDHLSTIRLGSVINKTCEVKIDDRGFHFENPFNQNDADHRYVESKFESGLVGGSSIEGLVTKSHWTTEKDKDVFNIDEIVVGNFGPCPNPCYKGSSAICRSFKSSEQIPLLRSNEAEMKELYYSWKTYKYLS